MFTVGPNIKFQFTLRRRAILYLTILLTLSLALGSISSGSVRAQGAKTSSALVGDLDAGFAAEWMQLFYDQVKADTVDAPGASRVYAYAGVALYEAVVPGMPSYV